MISSRGRRMRKTDVPGYSDEQTFARLLAFGFRDDLPRQRLYLGLHRDVREVRGWAVGWRVAFEDC